MEMMDQVCKNENENLRHAFSLKFPKEEWRKNERGAVFVMLVGVSDISEKNY